MRGSFRKRLTKAVMRRLDPPPPAHLPDTTLLSGQILVRDNLLDTGDFIKLQRWAFNVATPRTRDDRNWDELIKRDFAENKSTRQWQSDQDDVPEEAQVFLNVLRKNNIIADDDLLHFGVYRWERLSGMGVHQDSHTDTAITFYLNDVWEKDWGGDFVYYESSDDLRAGVGVAVMPAANRLVVNHSTIHHKVNYCSITAQDRVTIQAFVYKGQSR